jgi:hypothetical protein
MESASGEQIGAGVPADVVEGVELIGDFWDSARDYRVVY